MVKIIYEDDSCIIANKPSGMLVQSAKGFERDFVSELLLYRKNKGEDAYAAVINRIDRQVSGLVLVAKNKKSAAKYTSVLQNNGLGKIYLAAVCGKPKESSGVFKDYLVMDKKLGLTSIASESDDGAKYAELKYEIIEPDGRNIRDTEKITFVKVWLKTGRMHQIRVQFASRGMPLVGDLKYGKDKMPKTIMLQGLKSREIALCAYELTVNGHRCQIVPDWFEKIEN